MKKKLIILAASIAAIIALTFIVLKVKDKKGKSDSELFSFNIEDTASVDRILITDQSLNKVELTRKGNKWFLGTGEEIIKENIDHVLYVFKNIEFKGYVKESAKENHIKLLSTSATQVEIFQDGDKTKTWYIGTATPDHYGQVMLLDSEDDGKSDLPVLMKVRGLNGIIEPSFSADIRKWKSTKIIGLPIRSIKSVEVKNLEDSGRSFKVVQKGDYKFDVTQAGRKLNYTDTTAVLRYLSGYKKVHYEIPNYLLDEKQVDSLKKSTPFSILTVTDMEGKSTKLKMFRLQGAGESYIAEFATVVSYDKNNFWCLLPSGDLVKCQYFVFDPLTRGDIYFPFDKTIYQKKIAIEPGQ